MKMSHYFSLYQIYVIWKNIICRTKFLICILKSELELEMEFEFWKICGKW